MSWNALAFLAEPAFVTLWYLIGAVGAVWVAFDLARVNTPLKTAMKWAWPIVVFFFSVVGLALYFENARAPGIGDARSDAEKKKLHDDYERNVLRRVNGAVIHCVAGDGLGIMTAMVIARATGMTFWQEFWFEYAVGFAFGWLIFQLKSMTMMTDSRAKALWMAFRGEFFSMLTVMGGMGAVMTYVTPAVIGAQPGPLTFGFWGFGMLGLLVGYVFTYPMNFMLVKIGWKHGMGSAKNARSVAQPAARAGLVAAMAALGAFALAIPAWLTQVRVATPVAVADADTGEPAPPGAAPLAVLDRGLRQSLDAAAEHLARNERTAATHALDAARRVAMVGEHAAGGGAFGRALGGIRQARKQLQNGHPGRAHATLAAIPAGLPPASGVPPPPARAERYDDVPVLNARGSVIGEVQRVRGDRVELALGGKCDVFGFWDFGSASTLSVARSALVWGPRRRVGKSFVVLPTLQKPPVTIAAAGR